MTKPDHLPECRYVVFQQQGQIPEAVIPMRCICAALRACKQRVFQEQIEGRQHDMVMAYLRGLDAAREAVAAVGVRKDTSHDMRVQTLAAIDALREEQK